MLVPNDYSHYESSVLKKNKLLLTHGVTEMYINQRSSPFAKCLTHTGKTTRESKTNTSVLKRYVLFSDKKAE